jgi:hypothetical protein
MRPSERPPGPLGRLFGYRFYRCLACSTLFPAMGEISLAASSPADPPAQTHEEELSGALERELEKVSLYIDPWDEEPFSEPAKPVGPGPRKTSSA